MRFCTSPFGRLVSGRQATSARSTGQFARSSRTFLPGIPETGRHGLINS